MGQLRIIQMGRIEMGQLMENRPKPKKSYELLENEVDSLSIFITQLKTVVKEQEARIKELQASLNQELNKAKKYEPPSNVIGECKHEIWAVDCEYFACRRSWGLCEKRYCTDPSLPGVRFCNLHIGNRRKMETTYGVLKT